MAAKNTKKHKIGWLNVPGYTPETWNPIVGCSKISEGCRNCYAEHMAYRLWCMDTPGYCHTIDRTGSFGWNGKTSLLRLALEKPLHWKKPRAIFVNSMGDLFHENTPVEWIDRVFAVMALCPQHLFIVLTKRAKRMDNYFSKSKGVLTGRSGDGKDTLQSYDWPLQNVWLGVTAENQEAADERIQHLLRTPAAVRFVSCEPLIGAVNLNSACMIDYQHSLLPGNDDRPVITWVICGGESGPGARPMNPEWARSLRDQCQTADVPFFFKQWGDSKQQVRTDANYHGGDILDCRQWHEFPTIGKGGADG